MTGRAPDKPGIARQKKPALPTHGVLDGTKLFPHLPASGKPGTDA